MPDVVRVGVIGLGGVAILRHLPGFKEDEAIGKARLVAVYDLDHARAEAVAARFAVPTICASVEEMLALDELDAVSICTPNYLHHEQATAALRAGKHVLCEKPLAMDLSEARAMERLAIETGLVTMVNFRYRWIPAARFVADLVRCGELGTIYHGIFHYLTGMLVDPATPVSWRLSRAQTGSGALGDLGSHLIDLAGSWLGEPRAARGHLTTYVKQRPTLSGETVAVDVDDAARFTLTYDGGAEGEFLATRCALGRGNYQRVELYGTRGAVSYEFERWDRGGDTVHVCLGLAQGRHGDFSPVIVSPEHLQGTPTGVMHEFIDAIRTGRHPAPSFREGTRTQEIMTAIERSDAAGGNLVNLPLP